ncbi:hypothetical protein TNIN_355561 [Trichonephila inaurata madagascariensis]|uniref:Uncharacterized protein n=1 Tax=Trichonephila inaurata madagascariensis TaxID=2747483 RepID=A0A8X6X0Y2_9ARAC|nr:hypothetical protein TNIN_355561 [Trichonephila inaurata madagascariensis]
MLRVLERSHLGRHLGFELHVAGRRQTVSRLLPTENEGRQAGAPVHSELPVKEWSRAPVHVRHDHRADAASEERAGAVRRLGGRGLLAHHAAAKPEQGVRPPLQPPLQPVRLRQRVSLAQEVHAHTQRGQADAQRCQPLDHRSAGNGHSVPH